MFDVELEYVADQDVIDVGWNRPGEWLNYTVEVPETGLYAFDMRWGGQYDSPISVDVDFQKVGTWPIFHTEAMTTFDTHTYFKFELTQGTHVITVFTNRGRFDWLEIKKADRIPYKTHVIPGIIQAEDLTLAGKALLTTNSKKAVTEYRTEPTQILLNSTKVREQGTITLPLLLPTNG
jgi:hypothetical protein